MKHNWKNFNNEKIDLLPTLTKLIEDNKNDSFKVFVGTDSQQKKDGITYVTAIVFYREGIGGTIFCLKEKEKIVDLHSRLWNETYKAVSIASELNIFLKDFDMKVHEVHADLNPSKKHKSNTVVQSALGYICGMGFNGKIKPDSWAASKVANVHTK
jgi:predicted RNase H-related nuclease YkuK (DUF458 family)